MTKHALPSGAPVKVVKCPTCKGPSAYSPENAFRPFCCERCKQIDLGAWASEQFALPAHAAPDQPPPDDQEPEILR